MDIHGPRPSIFTPAQAHGGAPPINGGAAAEQETPEKYHQRKHHEAAAALQAGVFGEALNHYRSLRGSVEIAGREGHYRGDGVTVLAPAERSHASKAEFPVTPFAKNLIETLNDLDRESYRMQSTFARTVEFIKSLFGSDNTGRIPSAKQLGKMTPESFIERGESGSWPNEPELHVRSSIRLSYQGAELVRVAIARGADLRVLRGIIETHRCRDPRAGSGEWLTAGGWIPATAARHLEKLSTEDLNDVVAIAGVRAEIVDCELSRRFAERESKSAVRRP